MIANLMKYLYCCNLFLLLTCIQRAHSQDSYLIQHYTNENGLPANGIKGIELDKNTGFLWIGTQAGLVRFDGKRFTGFSSAKNPVASSRIYFIAKNREGTIYCEDDNFSVYRVLQNKPEFVVIDSNLVDPTMLRGGGSQISAQQMAQRLKKHPRSSFLPEWMIFDDERGDSSSFTFLYFGQPCHYDASRDSLICFTGQLFTQMLKLGGHIYFISENLDLWVYNQSLMKLQPVSLTGMPDWNKGGNEKPRFIWKPGMKEPLLIYKRDIWKLQGSADRVCLQLLCRECCPEDAYIYNAQVWEEQRMIFLGSEKNGLYVVRNPSVRTIRTDTLIEAGRAEYAQAEITPGMITTGYGLSFSPQSKLFYRKGGIEFHPWVIYRDHDGDHWFHTGDTVIHRHHRDGHFTKTRIGSGAGKMIFAETKNRLYVVTDMVIANITDDYFQQIYKLPHSVNAQKNSLNPDDAIEWKPGILAIATEKLILFDTGKKIAPDTIPIPGLTAKVRTLLKYDDYLLIGTYGQGFYIYKKGVVKKMPLDKKGYLSYTHCFKPDNNGFCWISTNHGLFKASMNALITAYEKNLPEIYYHYFGKDDGIFNTEFNGGCQPCALKLSSGLFSFPSMNGVVVFDPAVSHALPSSGQLFLDEIWIDTLLRDRADSSMFEVYPDVKSLRFKIAVPQFVNAENIYFSWKLEPYSEGWETQDLMTNDVLQFGRLKPGMYKLYLRVRNGFEPDQFSIKTISFEILKPWYQRWWFYTFCCIAFLALTWLLIQWRTASINKRKKELQQLVSLQTRNLEVQSRQLEAQLRQLKKQQQDLEADNQVKARLIGIISHDMLSPLKFMVEVGKKLRDAFEPSDPAHRVAESMVTITRELESLSVNMLNWIKFHHESFNLVPESFDLHQVVRESTEIAGILAAEKGVQLFNEVPKNSFIWQHRQAVAVIVYNLAMNAMKYTSTGEIRVSAEIFNERIIIRVADTGSGMPSALVDQLNSADSFYSGGKGRKHQFGYVIIKDLLQLTGGEMKAESTLSKGTKITITLKPVRESPSL